MLAPISIAVLLQLAAADGFPDEYDSSQQQAVDVLETFWSDLEFVQASVEPQRPREYQSLMDEYMAMSSRLEGQVSPSAGPSYEFLLGATSLLQADRPYEALSYLDEMRFDSDMFASGWKTTYFEYLQAETHRLLGNANQAASSLLSAFSERQAAPGVSVDRLERLDGLIMLQKVAQFNQAVDRAYGLMRSPDYRLLSLVHLMTRGDLRPLDELKSAVTGRLYRTPPSIRSLDFAADFSAASLAADGFERLDPHLDRIAARDVARATVERILCEFARKLDILGVTYSTDDAETDYSDVVGQLRQLDADFADKLDSKLVRSINGGAQVSDEAQDTMWGDLWVSAPPTTEVQVIFAFYFCIETSRRSRDACDRAALDEMQQDLNNVKLKRRTSPGLSLDKIVELEARVVLLWLRCFHERLARAYHLSGREEDRGQLEAKRALHGACERIPRSPAAGRA